MTVVIAGAYPYGEALDSALRMAQDALPTLDGIPLGIARLERVTTRKATKRRPLTRRFRFVFA